MASDGSPELNRRRSPNDSPFKSPRKKNNPKSPTKSPRRASPPTTALYSVVKKAAPMGGGAEGGPIYGEMSMKTFQSLIDVLIEKTNLNAGSKFLDVGAGLGKPNLHVALECDCESVGIELVGGRWWESMVVLGKILEADDEAVRAAGRRTFLSHNNLDEVETLDCFSHIYSFHRGFPPASMRKLAQLCNDSRSLEAVVLFDKNAQKHGLDLKKFEMIERVPLRMSGSGEGHSAYVYLKRSNEIFATPTKQRKNSHHHHHQQQQLKKLLEKKTLDAKYAPFVPHKKDYSKGYSLWSEAQTSSDESKYAEWVKSRSIDDSTGPRRSRRVRK